MHIESIIVLDERILHNETVVRDTLLQGALCLPIGACKIEVFATDEYASSLSAASENCKIDFVMDREQLLLSKDDD